MTTNSKLVSLDELLAVRQKAVDQLGEVQDMIARNGPVNLKFEVQSIRQDAEAVLSRLDNLSRIVQKAGIDGYQVDVEEVTA